ncbi:MAG: hypothetical protein RL213_1988 [Bacteroidota bacterium]|jgi:hypothetical protein
MKRFYKIVLLVSVFIVQHAVSVAQAYKVGANVLNAGVGFGYSIGYVSSATTTPVMHVSYEHGLRELGPGTFGIGGVISFQGATFSESNAFGTYDQRWSATYVGLRGTWHPDILVGGEYDVYGALQLGYVNYSYSFNGTGIYSQDAFRVTNNLSSGVGLGLVVGGRYYFTPKVAAFAELGYDLSYMKIGAAFHL